MSDLGLFKRVQFPALHSTGSAGATQEELLERLSVEVAERFARLAGPSVVTFSMAPSDDSEEASSSPQPVHPECAQFAGAEHCPDSLKAHLAELHVRLGMHWHRCQFGNFCALVPVVWKRRCLAVCKLVCPDSMGEIDFEHHVELLDVLVANFLSNESVFLSKLAHGRNGNGNGGCTVLSEREVRARARHPRVRESLDYVDRHLTDPSISVAGIARSLGINSTYLAHLFAGQVGVRMSRYISRRRVELAKKLLAGTNWPIKRVSFESGHANADWFSQVFRAHTGVTPRDYRRQATLA